MTVIYCDICGKRIEPKCDRRFRLLCYEHKGILADPDTTKLVYSSDDVCERCINRVNNYIAELKSEV